LEEFSIYVIIYVRLAISRECFFKIKILFYFNESVL